MSFCPNCGKEIPDGAICDCQNIENPIPKGKNKLILPVGVAVVAVAVIIGVSSAGGGYKKTVKDYIKAVNKCDTKKLLSVTIPENKMKEIKKEAKGSIIDWDALLDKMDDALEGAFKELEDDYGKNVKFSVKISDKEKIKGDDLDELQEEYEDIYDAEVKKAYKLKVEMTIKGKDDKDTKKSSLYVVKVKGDGWKVYDFDSGMDIGDAFSYSFF